jgi:hypothetical protein
MSDARNGRRARRNEIVLAAAAGLSLPALLITPWAVILAAVVLAISILMLVRAGSHRSRLVVAAIALSSLTIVVTAIGSLAFAAFTNG